jgi:hypothetical protein
MSESDVALLVRAHKHCSSHKQELLVSASCGCFYCQRVFASSEVEDWCDDGNTALCPYCGIDALIGDVSSFPITDPSFLRAMHQYWFENILSAEELRRLFQEGVDSGPGRALTIEEIKSEARQRRGIE